METTTENKHEITLEQILELLPKKVSLHYVDYQDSLDEHTETLQECISAGNMDILYNLTDEWYIHDHYGYDEVIKNLRSDLENAFEFDEDELDGIMEQYEDEIRDAIYDRDNSDVIKDLFRNTSAQTMFYDTGHYVESEYGESEAHYRLERIRIKKLLNIKDDTFDRNIDMMISQASYGGKLYVYFYDSVEDFINIDESFNTIEFSGHVSIAIVDNGNGSGDSMELAHSFELPLNKGNIFLDKEVSYSYTFDVCGMSSDWCEGTNAKSKITAEPGTIEKSSINEHIEREAKLDKIYKEGGCTAGDMKYTRHRDVEYINNYPCGNRCPHCSTFWID